MKEELKYKKEQERHKKVVSQIENAETINDLPNISYSAVSVFLANNIKINGDKLSQISYKSVITEIINAGMPIDNKVVDTLFNVIEQEQNKKTSVINGVGTWEIQIGQEKVMTSNPYDSFYNDKVKNTKKVLIKLLESTKIINIMQEVRLRTEKQNMIIRKENLDKHNEIMKQIKLAYSIKDLPKVGLGELNRKIIRAVNDNDYNIKFKISDIREITDTYLNNLNFKNLEEIVEKICEKVTADDKSNLKLEILGALVQDESIEYVAKEINAKEERKLFIYINDHRETMDNIKNARRISQLPSNLSVSTLTSYLAGNTTIYTNDNSIKSDDLKNLTILLLKGYRFNNEEIKNELKKITTNIYPNKEDAYDLLYNKLSKLSKTYYLVEEINYALKKQKEFIRNSNSNVNVYFIPNEKSPIDGGKFYNCYINRENNLDLSKILPLNLEEIIPPKMDIDSVEWYVQENYDETFTLAGGIILKNDETIGNVNIFKPNDGKVGITIEEKEKMDRIANLDEQIIDKEHKLEEIKFEKENTIKELEELKQKLEQIKSSINESILDYESRAFDLYKQMLDNAELLKEPLDSVKQKVKDQTV